MKKQFVKLISLFSVLVLLCCPVLHSFASALSATAEVVSAKVDPEVMAAFADGAETVEVYVWLNDIDQKQVDAIVEQKTGLRADNLAVIDENISDELAARIVSEADNDKLTDETENLLQAYLDRTAVQRTQERERTDLYTATRRAEAKAKYNQKSASFLSKNAINSEKVIFNSNYAPMLILELTKQEVKTIATRPDVKKVTIYKELLIKDFGSIESNFEDIELTRIKTVSGLTGANVKLGQLETFLCDPAGFTGRYHALSGILYNNSHAESVASIMVGDNGVAEDAILYTAGFCERIIHTELPIGGPLVFPLVALAFVYDRIEELIDAGVSVINCSFGMNYEDTNSPFYDDACEWFDHVSAQHNVLMVASSGDDFEDSDTGDDSSSTVDTSNWVSQPALAGNVLAVGAYRIHMDENGEKTSVMLADTGYIDGSGVEKPDVVSVGEYTIIIDNETKTISGTSFAAPVVTGIIGLILELRPALSIYPHVLKSIVMASCHKKALPASEGENAETMTAGLTEKQGAGIVNPYIAIAIASHGTYGFGEVESGSNTEYVKFLQPITAADSINVTVTWLRENTVNGNDHVNEEENENNIVNVGLLYDIDFHVNSHGSILGYATKSNTAAEMMYAYFDNGDNENFEIVVRRYGSLTQNVRYAYAWSVNSMRFQYNQPFEGIGYLKNLNSSYYMEADTTALTMSQQTFDGDANQMWILRRNANASTYKLQSAYGTIGSVADSSSISNSSASVVTVSLNDDGTYSFIRTNGTTQYILGISNNATTAGAGAVWQLKGDTVFDSQKWYFELCAYERGDYDKNGTINAEDARMILRASAGTETPDTMQTFLSDVDGNGVLSSIDAYLANRYSAGFDS